MKELIPAIESPDGLFHDGNPLTGELGTIVPAKWLNDMQGATQATQSEILSLLASAGIEASAESSTQLLQALNKRYLQTDNSLSEFKEQNKVDDVLKNLGLDTALNNKQPKSATLTALARLSGVGNTLPYFNGVDYADLTEFTSIGRSIVGQASVAGVVDYLGLKDALNALIKTNNLSDLQNVVTSRSNLGVPKGVDKQMCAAWASFGYRNGSVVIDDGFNISSITRVRLGYYKVVFLTPLNSARYSVSGSALFGNAGAVVFSPCSDSRADSRETTSFELSISDASDNSFKDSELINFQIFGGI